MPTISHSKKEVLLKLVYYGPGLGGKTTNLDYIHAHSRPEHRGKLLSLASESERTLFFDLLPVDLGKFKTYSIRLHLCTVPGQVAYDRTRKLILRNVDGVVFVVDSQPAQLEANVESLANLATNLRAQGTDPDRLPVVVQYNKRDLPQVLTPEALARELGIPPQVHQVEASAKFGQGVFETLKLIVTECLKLVGDPRKAREGRSPSILPGHRPSMYPGALIAQDRPAQDLDVPKPPRAPDVPEPAAKNGRDWRK
jgi:signal recognition particle receptor subunit beta